MMTSRVPLPEALQSMGPPLEIHPPKSAAGRAGYFAAGVVCALFAGLAVLGVVDPPAHHAPPAVVLVAVVGVLLMLSLTFLGMGFLTQNHTLLLFPDGIARVGASVTEMFRWDEIREIYTFVHPLAAKQKIVSQDGRKLEIDASVSGGKELGLEAQQKLFDRMRPEAEAAFDRGETVTFGPLRVDWNYISYKDRRLPWNDVVKMWVGYNAHTHCVQLEVTGGTSAMLPWCVVKAHQIPNIDVFKTLAERMTAFAQQR